MTAHGYIRGHAVHFDGAWRYEDGELVVGQRPCVACGEPPTAEGYDACLGYIEDVTSACCGHGIECGYVVAAEKERP